MLRCPYCKKQGIPLLTAIDAYPMVSTCTECKKKSARSYAKGFMIARLVVIPLFFAIILVHNTLLRIFALILYFFVASVLSVFFNPLIPLESARNSHFMKSPSSKKWMKQAEMLPLWEKITICLVIFGLAVVVILFY